MHIDLEIIPNKDYYEEYYSEWLNERSKYTKYQPVLGGVIIIFSVILLYFLTDPPLSILPFIIFMYGIYTIINFYKSKVVWVNERMKSKITDEVISLVFKDEIIEHKGPLSQGDMKWEIVNAIKETSNGLFLILQGNSSIYISKSAFKNKDDIKSILEKIEEGMT